MTSARITKLLLSCGMVTCLPAQSLYTGGKSEIALRNAHFPAQMHNDIIAFKEKGYFGEMDVDDARKFALRARVSYLKLARDGSLAIQVRGAPDDPNAGATGNGDWSIFKRIGNHAVLILDGAGYMLSSLPTYHHGMRDLKIAVNSSCCEGGVEVYQFDGIRYKGIWCYQTTSDENGWKDGPLEPCKDN